MSGTTGPSGTDWISSITGGLGNVLNGTSNVINAANGTTPSTGTTTVVAPAAQSSSSTMIWVAVGAIVLLVAGGLMFVAFRSPKKSS